MSTRIKFFLESIIINSKEHDNAITYIIYITTFFLNLILTIYNKKIFQKKYGMIDFSY